MTRLVDKNEFLFFMAFIPWVLMRTLFTTGFRDFFPNEGVWVYRLILIGCLAIVGLKIICERFYVASYLASYLVILILVSMVGVFSGRQGIILNCLLIFAAGNIPLQKILKVSLIIMGGVLLVTQVADWLSLYPNVYDSVRDDGRIRHAIGFLFVTYGPNFFFHFVVLYQAWRGSAIKLIELVTLLGIAIYYYYMTDTKAAFYFVILAMIAHAFVTYIDSMRLNQLINQISQHIISISAIFTIGLSLLYMKFESYLTRIDQLLTGRLALAKQGLSRYGIPLLGQPIKFVGYQESEPYFYIDFSFLNILLNYGLVLLILLALGYYLLVKQQRLNHKYLQVGLILIALHSIFDPQFIEIEYNSLLLLLGRLFYEQTSDYFLIRHLKEEWNMQKARVIDLVDWLNYLLSKWLIILGVALAIMGGTFFVLKTDYQQYIIADTTLMISMDMNDMDNVKSIDTLSEVRDYQTSLTELFIAYAKLDSVKDETAQRMGYDSFSNLSDQILNIEFKDISKNQLISLQIQGKTQQVLKNFEQAYLEQLREIMTTNYQPLQLKVVNQVPIEIENSSLKSRIKRPLILGVVAAGSVALLFSAMYFFDGKVRSDDELMHLFDVTQLIHISGK